MATPIQFPEVNRGLTKPDSMTDEQCKELPVFTDGRNCISCWQLDEAELAALIANGGKIWLGVVSGQTQPPVFVQVENPIRYSTDPLPEPLPPTQDPDEALHMIANMLPGNRSMHLGLLRAAAETGGRAAVVAYLQPYSAYLSPQA